MLYFGPPWPALIHPGPPWPAPFRRALLMGPSYQDTPPISKIVTYYDYYRDPSNDILPSFAVSAKICKLSEVLHRLFP